jgi:uncharacterized membrane-anchored protein
MENVTTNSTSNQASNWGKLLLNKVPEITIYFWIIKVLGTTIGETAADFLNVNLNLGLTTTSIVMGVLLVIALIFQFRSKKYTPSIYWITVVFISVFGTLVTDNLTDRFGVPLELSTIIFTVLLGIAFAVWYSKEKTLSIHSIVTRKREAFYWLVILLAFALGTASGDLMAEGLALGYLTTGIIVAVLITIFAVAWKWGLNAILAFWVIYILTRPLGASIGDFLSQPYKFGGLGLGATITSVIFLAAILILVAYLTITKKDVTTRATVDMDSTSQQKGNTITQVIATTLILIIASMGGYYWRSHQTTQNETAPAVSNANSALSTNSSSGQSPQSNSVLGDLSTFKTITQDTLNLVNKGDMTGARTRVADLESEWDQSESQLKPKNKAKWTELDDAIDTVLNQLRARNPNQDSSKAALEDLLNQLN